MMLVRHPVTLIALGLALMLQLAGCAADARPAEIPAGAREMGTSKGSVFWTAPYQGNVYVYSVTSGELLYSGQLQRGQTVRASADSNQVTVDNITVAERGMVGDHEYKIYFQRMREGSQSQQASPSQGTSPQRSQPAQAQPQQPAQVRPAQRQQ